MEDLKKIQEFFSKPLNENIVVRMYNPTDKTANLYKEDNPGLEFYFTGKEGQDYIRKYKDHISFPFSSHMNDGTPIPNYEENKEKLAAYLKQKGIPFKTTSAKPYRGVSRTTGEDFMYTADTFKVPLSHVDIKDMSLEEGKQLDQVDFAKVVQAVTKTGHPVTVLLVPKFNEIEVITGMNAPDDMLFDLSNAVDALGYGNDDIIIAGDSSNLSRREYSDIRRVNGGAKDYFKESLDEAKRPEPNYKELVKLLIMAFKHEPKSRFYFNRNNGVVYFDLIGGAAYSPKKSTMRDIFGGMSPIAVNREFGRADHHEEETIKQVEQLSKGKIKAEIKELGNGVLYKLKNELDGVDEATKDEETEFHKKLDTLVHDTFGKRKGELEEEEEGYSQFLKTDDNPEGKTKGLTPNVMNKILMNVIKDLDELKQLGEGVIEEELCEKGKRYIKARQAAGEKSSAYLSGRAVRVCKGQIEWPKKGKKKK